MKKKETWCKQILWSRFFQPPRPPTPPLSDPVDNIRCRSRGTSISWLAGWSRSLVDSKINYSSVHPKCTSILSWPLVCFSSAARIVAQSGVSIGVPFEVDQLTAADENRDGWSRLFFLLFLHSFFLPWLLVFFLLEEYLHGYRKFVRKWGRGGERREMKRRTLFRDCVLVRVIFQGKRIWYEKKLERNWIEGWEKIFEGCEIKIFSLLDSFFFFFLFKKHFIGSDQGNS